MKDIGRGKRENHLCMYAACICEFVYGNVLFRRNAYTLKDTEPMYGSTCLETERLRCRKSPDDED